MVSGTTYIELLLSLPPCSHMYRPVYPQSVIRAVNQSLPLHSQDIAIDSRSRTSSSARSVTLSDSRSETQENQSLGTTRITNRNIRASLDSGFGFAPTTSTAQRPVRLLEYPRDFFNKETGAGPSTPEEAERLWIYRKNRRTDGLADTEEPNGRMMLEEIKAIRESLRAFISESYNEGIISRARELNIRMKDSNSYPVHQSDFRKILNGLQSTSENHRLVFELVHSFHKDRHWLADSIDKWLLREGMCLLPQQKPKFVDGKRTRICPTDRGGFSAIGRSAKSQAVAGLMVPMLQHAGWSISLTKGQCKNNNYERKVRYNNSTFFYVVVRSEQVRRPISV